MEIRKVGEEVLRRPAKPVKKVNRQIKDILDEMAKTMYESKGVGLAAPQVGISKRIIVLDVGEGLKELVNPEILHREGIQTGLEGCLSVPGLVGEVERAQSVRVSGVDRYGNRVWIDAEGLLSRCLQHEIDHLNGVLFTDIALKVMDAESVHNSEAVVLD